MNTFILTFGIFTLAMMAMAIGVIVNNRAIKGTCGGLNDIDGLEGACDICEVKEQCKRRRRMQREALNKNAATFRENARASHDNAATSHDNATVLQNEQRSLAD